MRAAASSGVSTWPATGKVDPSDDAFPRSAGDRRDDIQGLRGIAVILVLLFHAGVTWVPGGFVGVDVFFVLSGYLITGLLIAEAERTGRISILGFYARRARRLLPAAFVVLAATAALTALLLPRIRWVETGQDIAASAAFVINWQLADRSVDYLAAERAPSAVQHFWSLAVEEQFYLVWPLVLVVMLWLRSRRRPAVDLRILLLVPLAVIGVSSLAWSAHLSTVDPSRAYFVTTTRVWELVLGAVVAVLGTSLGRVPVRSAVGLAWAGLASVLVSPLLISTAMPFPGLVALVPTLGAAALLGLGVVAGKHGPASLLGVRPLRVLGTLSYSLYLWHWPLLVVAEARWGVLSGGRGALVAAAAVFPAVLTYVLVENPLRHRAVYVLRPVRGLRLGAVCTAGSVAAGLLLVLSVGPAASVAPDKGQGPGVLEANPEGDPAGQPVDDPGPFVPTPEQARSDLPVVYERGCHADQSAEEATPCVLGVRDAGTTVAVVGDSHAAQWVPALEKVAEARGWRLLSYTKSNCPLSTATFLDNTGQPYDSCRRWNEDVVRDLRTRDRPDLVVATSFLGYQTEDGAPLDAGFREAWTRLVDDGLPVLAIEDTPAPGFDIAECVSANAGRLTRCAVPRPTALGDRSGSQAVAAAGLPGVSLVDLNTAVCPTAVCAPVIGGVLVYRDRNHMTATYAGLLAPRLGPALSEALKSGS